MNNIFIGWSGVECETLVCDNDPEVCLNINGFMCAVPEITDICKIE